MKDMVLDGSQQFEREGTSKTTSNEMTYTYGAIVTKLFALFTFVAAIGWTVSTFLTGIHFWALPLPAGVDVSGGPLAVMTSEWAYVMGIPLALLGAVYYLTVLTFSGLWFQTRSPLVLKILTPITVIGVASSAVFVYLQLFVIGAICPFCMVSAGATTVLLILEIIMLKNSKLPPVKQLIRTAPQTFNTKSVTWMALLFAVGALPVIAFWIVTTMPIPG